MNVKTFEVVETRGGGECVRLTTILYDAAKEAARVLAGEGRSVFVRVAARPVAVPALTPDPAAAKPAKPKRVRRKAGA